jgi:hypothetical protein
MSDGTTIYDQMGKNGFFWFHGLIEDNNDPLKLGRVRVRCFEYHTQNKDDLPTADLPWATVLMPTTSSSVSGKGISPSGLLQGSWVIGFFRDGNNLQDPIVIGSFHGIPGYSSVPSLGFNDPQGKWPDKDHLNEPDTNRLSRNESIEKTIVEKKKKDKIVGVKTALQPWLKWNEKETPYAAEYPKNHVIETESGHIIELDDTPDKERIGVYHKAGTWMEIHPDGSKVEKIVGEDNEIILSDKKLLIKGNCYMNMDGAVTTLKAAKDFYIEIGGDVLVHTKGNVVMETDKNFEHRVHGTYTVASDGGMLFVAPRIDFNPEGVQPGLASSPNMNLGQASPLLKNTAIPPETLAKLQDRTSGVFLNTDYLKNLNAQTDLWKTNGSNALQTAVSETNNEFKSWGDNQAELANIANKTNNTATIPSNLPSTAKITNVDSSGLYTQDQIVTRNRIQSITDVGTDEQVIQASQAEKTQVDAAIESRTSQQTQLQQVVGESNVNLVTSNQTAVVSEATTTSTTQVSATSIPTTPSVTEPLSQSIGGVLNSLGNEVSQIPSALGGTLEKLSSGIDLSNIVAIGSGIGLAGVAGPAGVVVGGAVGGALALFNPPAAIQAVNSAANIAITTVPSPSSFLSSGPQSITNLSAVPLPPVGGGLSGAVTDTNLVDIGAPAIPTQSLYAVPEGTATLISAYPGRDSINSATRGIPAIPIVAFESEFPAIKEDITEIDGGEF